jgi:hypothetical protein
MTGKPALVRNICHLLLSPFLLSMLISCESEPLSTQPLLNSGAAGKTEYSGSFPRFPHDTQARTLRDVMVFYSPDDIFSNITWQTIGYPDNGFFMIHNAFPKLKVTMQAVPENRYLGEIPNRNIENDPVAGQIWRDLFDKPEFRSWLEFGNHGYFHSPEGDANLDHHEFDGSVNAEAHDSAFCYRTFARARHSYAAVGLDNDRISVMRFPGYKNTPMALQALADNGFLAYFDFIRSGQERYVDLGKGKELLAIPTIHLFDLCDTLELGKGILNGEIDSANLKDSQAYQAALSGALLITDYLVLGGGVINLFDHWWEHSFHQLNGIRYRFELFKDILAGLDRKHGKRVWWGFGSELARWSHLKRNTPVTVERDELGLTVSFGQPAAWKSAWALDAGYTLTRNGAPDFPEPAAIGYTLESEGYATVHSLGKGDYWVAENRLYFDFPYSGATKVRITFGGK